MDTAIGLLTHELFEEQAARTPEAVAVVAGLRRVSYRELDELANGVARRLAEAGVVPGALVGVCMGRDERLIAALLGVFKAGAGYVPLDPAYPAERLAFIGEDAGLSQVLVTAEHAELAATTGGALIALDDLAPAAAAPELEVSPGDPAYVVYTSGSTGRAKGVVIEHRNTANFVRWMASTIDAEEIAGSLAALSVSFDGSIMEIFPPLVSGGTVIVAESLLELPTLPAREEVTTVVGPPSALRVLLQQGLPASVRTVYPVGEALTSAFVRELFAQPGVSRVRNGYGPTETTTLSHCHDMLRESFTDSGDAPPIGRLVAGAEGLVLDGAGEPVAEGQVGELWIAGPGVARGYLNRAELTAERFVADPGVAGGRRYRTGDLVRRQGDVFHYTGRIDDQVKIRGFRVELGEVEAALSAHPDVAAAVATAPADVHGVRTLFGYVEPKPGATIDEEQVRDYLSGRMPAYLVPSRIGVLASIPLGPTGKADRSVLPALAPAVPRAASVAPRDDREALIAEVFAEVLELDSVGVFDDFFLLGGHSLSAALAVARVSDRLAATVPLTWLLTEPTVAALAARVEAGAEDEPRAERHPGRTTFPLTGMQAMGWTLMKYVPGGTNTVGFELRVAGLPDVAALQTVLDGIVRRHEVLRTIVVEENGMPVAAVQPAMPVPLEVVDARDYAADGEVEEIIRGVARHIFDLGKDIPLIRATLVWTASAEARLAIAVDHFSFDGYSVGLFLDELATGIAAVIAGEPDPTPEPALQVGDVGILFQELAARPAREEMRAFWRAELDGANSPNLPGTRREKWPMYGRRLIHLMDSDAEARLRALETACGATRFTVFAAALNVLLSAQTGASDNLIGIVSALRDRPGLDRVIGPLFEVIPMRVRLPAGASFRQLASAVVTGKNRALANQELGMREISMNGGAEDQLGNPLLPVLLSMQPDTVPVAVERGPVRIELAGELDPGNTVCDLAVLVNPVAEGIQLQMIHDTARMTPGDVDLFTQRLLRVIDAAAADPDQPVAGLGWEVLQMVG